MEHCHFGIGPHPEKSTEKDVRYSRIAKMLTIISIFGNGKTQTPAKHFNFQQKDRIMMKNASGVWMVGVVAGGRGHIKGFFH